jgi:hypothetical protein
MLVLPVWIRLHVCKTRFELQCDHDAFLPNQCYSVQTFARTFYFTDNCLGPPFYLHIPAFHALFTEEDNLEVCQQIRPDAYLSVRHNRWMCPIDLPGKRSRVNPPCSPWPRKIYRTNLRTFHWDWSCIDVEHRNISHL